MYLPTTFACTNRAELLAVMRAYPFATLITTDAMGPQVGHLPWLSAVSGEDLVLRGHLAAANPQCHHADSALAIFHGPHAYISATWYDADDTVPTWNYQVVQVRGELSFQHDVATKERLLDDLAAAMEGSDAQQWQARLSSPVRARLLEQIVACELRVQSICGKWKLGQNQPRNRRQRTVTSLRQLGGDDRVAIADAMERTLNTDGGGT